MAYSFLFLPLIVMALSLGVSGFIVYRHAPTLSVLDVANIPEVQEERKKEAFLKKRVEKNAEESARNREIHFAPVLTLLKKWQSSFRRYFVRLERNIRRASERPVKTRAAAPIASVALVSIRGLLSDAEHACAEGDYENAENGYIAAIRIDAKNADAYRGLANVYFEQGHLNEAKETYTFVLSLDPTDDSTLMKLSDIAVREGALEKAVEYVERAILLNDNLATRFATLSDLLRKLGENDAAFEAARQAADLEPQSAMYLDSLAEIAILAGDRESAQDAIRSLRMVNPAHPNLASLQDKIKRMPS